MVTFPLIVLALREGTIYACGCTVWGLASWHTVPVPQHCFGQCAFNEMSVTLTALIYSFIHSQSGVNGKCLCNFEIVQMCPNVNHFKINVASRIYKSDCDYGVNWKLKLRYISAANWLGTASIATATATYSIFGLNLNTNL